MTTTLNIVPLSVNNCWQGRRFKTPDYKLYEKAVLLMLPAKKLPLPPFRIDILFGFSSPLADIDNPLKPFLDLLQKKYGINDRDVFELNVKKEIIGKGKEFIQYEIIGIEKNQLKLL